MLPNDLKMLGYTIMAIATTYYHNHILLLLFKLKP